MWWCINSVFSPSLRSFKLGLFFFVFSLPPFSLYPLPSNLLLTRPEARRSFTGRKYYKTPPVQCLIVLATDQPDSAKITLTHCSFFHLRVPPILPRSKGFIYSRAYTYTRTLLRRVLLSLWNRRATADTDAWEKIPACHVCCLLLSSS